MCWNRGCWRGSRLFGRVGGGGVLELGTDSGVFCFLSV